MKDKDQGVIILVDPPKTQYAVSCLICGKTVRIYDEPIIDISICEDCKRAVAYAKKLMEKGAIK